MTSGHYPGCLDHPDWIPVREGRHAHTSGAASAVKVRPAAARADRVGEPLWPEPRRQRDGRRGSSLRLVDHPVATVTRDGVVMILPSRRLIVPYFGVAEVGDLVVVRTRGGILQSRFPRPHIRAGVQLHTLIQPALSPSADGPGRQGCGEHRGLSAAPVQPAFRCVSRTSRRKCRPRGERPGASGAPPASQLLGHVCAAGRPGAAGG